jgi:membrane-associated phospholipid phosphatase
MSHSRYRFAAFICFISVVFPFTLWSQSAAQSTASSNADEPDVCGINHLARCFEDLLQDQEGIWTSPLRTKRSDLLWITPIAAGTGLGIAYDSEALHDLGVDQTRFNISNDISDFGSFYTTAGAGAGVYFLGLAKDNPKLAETGRLAAESVIDAGIVDVPLKIAANRERPYAGNGNGEFWPHGTRDFTWDGSFPSGHATASWALAHVVSAEYPGVWTSIGAYGFATVISVARITGQDHFPSDVLVGGTIGYLVSGYVIHHRMTSSSKPSIWHALNPIVEPESRTVGLMVNFQPDVWNRNSSR